MTPGPPLRRWVASHPLGPYPMAEALAVKVLGGSFIVRELQASEAHYKEQALAELQAAREDRWIVLVSDHPDHPGDALALIDDDLKLRVIAYGRLQPD